MLSTSHHIPPDSQLLSRTVGNAQRWLNAYPIAKHVVVQCLPSLQPNPLLWVFIREEQPKIIGWKTQRDSVWLDGATGMCMAQQHPCTLLELTAVAMRPGKA